MSDAEETERKIKPESLRLLRLSNNPDSPYYMKDREQAQVLLQQYYHLRCVEYQKFGILPPYPDGPQKDDEHRDTAFILVLDENGDVLGGRRLLVHEPHSGTLLKTEKNPFLNDEEFAHDPLPPGRPITIAEQLPHLDTESMRYAEMGGLIFSPKLRGCGFLPRLYADTFAFTEEMQCDFLVGETVPHNLAKLVPIAQAAGAKQIVLRRDQRCADPVEDDFRTFISFRSEKELRLLSKEQKAQGLGAPPTTIELQELAAVRQRHHQQEGIA